MDRRAGSIPCSSAKFKPLIFRGFFYLQFTGSRTLSFAKPIIFRYLRKDNLNITDAVVVQLLLLFVVKPGIFSI